MDKTINKCIECKSDYFANASKMKRICPDCAHKLYDYPRCFHKFENGRCTTCYWNGKSSEYLEEKKKRILKKKKRIQRDKIFGIVAIVMGSFIVLVSSLALSISVLGLLGIILGVRLLLQTKKQKKELKEKGMV